MREIKYLAIIISLLLLFPLQPFSLAQDIVQPTEPQNIQAVQPQLSVPPQVEQQVSKEKKEKRFLILFRKSKEKEKYLKEKRELSEKYQKERKEARGKYQKDKEEARKRKIQEKEAEKNKSSVIFEEKRKKKELTGSLIKKREEEVKTIHKAKRHVEVVTNENDPLFIAEAAVLDSKTSFLKIKGVELKYKLEVYNQTPKIINTVLMVWERKIPFSNSQIVVKETRVSKPIIPYEKRIIEYNELDTTRQGEIYKVKITTIIFEDGTQWKNPSS